MDKEIESYRKNRRKKTLEKIKKIIDKSESCGIMNMDGGNNKLVYGLCKAAGIDTKGMEPHEAWEALKKETGMTPSDVYAGGKEKSESKESGKREKEQKPPKLVYDDPESVALYKKLKAGEYLPLKELMEHPVTKMLNEKAHQYKKKYGTTAYINTPERMKLRKKIKHDYLKTGSARVVDSDGERKVVYDGPLKKEFKACIVIGLAASGKSSQIVEPWSSKNGAFVSDCDRINEEIPEFKESNGGAANCVHKEARHLSESALKEFYKGGSMNGTNVVIPIIGAWMPDIEEKVKQLEEGGYDVEVKYQDASPVESANRMVMRAIETGRIVPLGNVEKNGEMPKQNWEEIRKWGDGKYVKS